MLPSTSARFPPQAKPKCQPQTCRAPTIQASLRRIPCYLFPERKLMRHARVSIFFVNSTHVRVSKDIQNHSQKRDLKTFCILDSWYADADPS
jgi:hypothetical protein